MARAGPVRLCGAPRGRRVARRRPPAATHRRAAAGDARLGSGAPRARARREAGRAPQKIRRRRHGRLAGAMSARRAASVLLALAWAWLPAARADEFKPAYLEVA